MKIKLEINMPIFNGLLSMKILTVMSKFLEFSKFLMKT